MKNIKLQEELAECYDFDNLKAQRELTTREIINVVIVLKRININDEMIKEFILSSINTYFDFNNMKAIRVLDLNSIIDIVCLLDFLGADEEIIDEFIYESEDYLRHTNKITYLKCITKKLSCNVLDDEEAFKQYDKVKSLLEIVENKSDIVSLKQIHAHFNTIADSIANDYTYEKQKAKSLLKIAV